jgi:hypothetical protein
VVAVGVVLSTLYTRHEEQRRAREERMAHNDGNP